MPTTLEEAIHIIEQLQAENDALKQQLAELTEQLPSAQQAQPKGQPKVKASVPKREPKQRRKRDPQHNRGRKRQEPTRIETHACAACPDCGRTLTGGSVARTRQVIDLPPPQPVEVVEHQVIERYCVHCDAEKTPTLDLTGQVLGQSRIGVRVAALWGTPKGLKLRPAGTSGVPASSTRWRTLPSASCSAQVRVPLLPTVARRSWP